MKPKSLPFTAFEHKRDAYGFAARPQHLQRYKEYAGIYKEEEEERSDRWKNFLTRQTESSGQDIDQNAGGGSSETLQEKTTPRPRKIEIWTPIRPSLSNIEQIMSPCVEKQQSAGNQHAKDVTHSVKVEQDKLSEDSDDQFYDVDKVDPAQEIHSGDAAHTYVGSRSQQDCISKEELECPNLRIFQ